MSILMQILLLFWSSKLITNVVKISIGFLSNMNQSNLKILAIFLF